MPVYPFSHHSGEITVGDKKQSMLDYLRARGEKYRELVGVPSTCMIHRGSAEEIEFPKRRTFLDGRVIVDQDEGENHEIDLQYYRYEDDETRRMKPHPMKGASKEDEHSDWVESSKQEFRSS